MKWAYGITTVSDRANDLLPRTLTSLKRAGFDWPHIFMDGSNEVPIVCSGMNISHRVPRIRTYGNWILGMWELFLRVPDADRYAMFQDDMVTYKNLRDYLERLEYRPRCYWNLYSMAHNSDLAKGNTGFHLSNQRGHGAVALVFDRDAVKAVLASQHSVDRVENTKVLKTGWQKGQESVDGAVISALQKAGYVELTHNPTLVEHIGVKSTMGHGAYPRADSFRGEDFDALSLIG